VSIIRLHNRLHWARNTILLSLAVIAYVVQLIFGIILIRNQHDSNAVNNISYVVFATLVISLQRAWSLLKGKHLADREQETQPHGGHS
jgi:heme/copper-type cytochrome/quinol oxidase subunit 4